MNVERKEAYKLSRLYNTVTFRGHIWNGLVIGLAILIRHTTQACDEDPG